MQLKMQDILGFTSFYNTVKSQKLIMKTAYKLAQLAKAIDGELQFYREKLQAIIQEYGEVDENGQPVSTESGDGIKLRPGTEMQCMAAMHELQMLDVNLPDIKFHLEDFGDIELSTTEMTAVLPFIEE
jgi:hypothetical protein